MKIHKANIDRIIKINGLREVTDLTLLDKGVPTEQGLFSYSIFGHSQNERKSIPAYIDLKGKYLHPLTYNNLKSVNRKFESLIAGTKYYRILDDGTLVEDAQNGGTGLDFLYKNWDKIKFKDTQSIFGAERIKNISDKKTAWVDKWIVLPAFFRDLNFNQEGRPSYDEINEKYINILRMVSNVSQQEQYGFVSNITKARIQFLINEIHDQIVEKHLRAKHGTFKRYVMSKNVDFGARLVISAPKVKGERFNDMQVRFNQMGVPLSTMCSIFFPFVVYGVREFFQNEFVHGGKYPYQDPKTGEVKYVTLVHPESVFSDEYIIKMIKKFIFGTSTRFETIDIPDNTDGIKMKMQIAGRFGKDQTSVRRPMTWTDILFIVCSEVLADKHIYATRYPIEDQFGISPSKVSILTTRETTPAIIGDKTYKFYPIVRPDKPSDREFVDTLNLPLAYLSGYGADFDGDMMSITGVFTNEANQDAERQTQNKKNILTVTTENMRIAQRDFVQTYYALTKYPKGDSIPEFKNLSRVAQFK